MSYLQRLSILVILLHMATLVCGQKYDYTWGFGYGNDPDNAFGMTLFDWNDGLFKISNGGGFVLSNASQGIRFRIGKAGAVYADRYGRLALMTNNCHIIGADTDTIPNGSDITPSATEPETCEEFGSLAVENNTVFLPNRSNDSIVYLIHRGREVYFSDILDITADTLYMTTIRQQVDGSYSVVEKTKKINVMEGINGRVIGIPDEEEVGWWFFTVERGTNAFYVQHLDTNGIVSAPVISESGPINFWPDKGGIALNIANDGRTIALSNDLGTGLYDFDRKTGEFSNFRNINAEVDRDTRGFCWSPSNRFLYVSERSTLVQFDMEAEPPLYDSIHLAQVWGLLDTIGWPLSTSNMHLAPDCKIYIAPGSTAQAFHVIHYPDKKGMACLPQLGIPLPTIVGWNFPMVTKYRMGTGKAEVCDSTIAWFAPVPSSIEESLVVFQELQVYPNPSDGHIYFAADGNMVFDQVKIYAIHGQEVYSHIGRWEGRGYLDVSYLESGVYILQATREAEVWQAKVVIK